MSFQKPAYLNAIPNKGMNKDALAGAMARPPRVSFYNTRFTLIGSDGEKRPANNPLQLDVIIVDVNPNKNRYYYEGEFDAEDSQGPLCWSGDSIKPSVSAREPQSETCATCAHSVWGSFVTKEGVAKAACAQKKMIAVIIPGETEPFLLGIPGSAIKSKWVPYIQHVESNGAELNQVITRITAGPGVGELGFAFAGWIPESAVAMVLAQDEDHLARLVSKVDEPYRPMGGLALPPRPAHVAIPAPKTLAEVQAEASARVAAYATPDIPRWDSSDPVNPQNIANEQERQRRKPRATKAEMEARRAQTANINAAQATPAAPRPASVPQFGIVDNAPAPDADLSAALDSVFNLPV